MDGSQVWEAFRTASIDEIRSYCEADVANTYLVYLRFQQMRGVLSRESYAEEVALVRATLGAQAEPHWREFLQRWPA